MKTSIKYLTIIFLINSLFVIGCTNKKERHLGTWKSSPTYINGVYEESQIWEFNEFNELNFVNESNLLKIKYEIDYSKDPISLDIIYIDKKQDTELFRGLSIVKFPSKNKMEISFGEENNRFEQFDSGDIKNTLFLERVFNDKRNEKTLVVQEVVSKTKKFPYYKTDLEEMNLRGKVKTFREYSYKTIDSFGIISKGEIQYEDGYELYPHRGYFTFNKDGKYDEIIEYDKNELIVNKTTHVYNEKGNKIEENVYDSNGKFDYKVVFKYNDKEYLIGRSIYNEDGSIDNKHVIDNNEEYQIISKKYYNSKGESDSFDIFTYDEKGNLIETNHNYFPNESSIKSFMRYDEKGNLIKENSHHTIKEGSVEIITNFTYNKYGDKIEKWFDNSRNSKTTYEYEYDFNNNWIKRIEYNSGFPKYILEREIEYY